MNAEIRNASHSPKLNGENTLLRISRITGLPDLQNISNEHACEQLIQWWRNISGIISKLITDLPEEFRTTRIWRHIKFVSNYSMRLEPVFNKIQAETYDLNTVVDRFMQIFSDEEERLEKWQASLENIQGLFLWLPTFFHARDYLLTAFPLGQEYSDTLRQSLVRSIRDPYPFLEAGTRERFDKSFLEFKKNYIDNYVSLHEAMRNTIRDVKKEESKVDTVALRNLELLSKLQYTDKSYLNRVNILAGWIKRNQCTLPVSRILERYPRCYCNFNPCSIRQPSAPVDQINVTVNEGIQYFRSVLDRCREKIEKEAKAKNTDKNIMGQVDAFLDNEVMIPLEEQTIEGINLILRRHANYFYSRIVSKF